MKKKVVFLLASVLMMAGCQNKENGQNQADQKSFETMTVSKQDITLSQSYPASVEGRQSVKIIPRVEGYLREIKVKHVNVSDFEKEKIDIDPNFVEAVEILKKSGFINAEYTSKRR